VLELVRNKSRFFFSTFFLSASVAALALRVFLLLRFPGVVDDSRLYADIARNWLHHGVYAVTDSGRLAPTLSRLPGYPAFLAAIFALFGDDHYRAVLLVQTLFDLATCFLIADMARRLFSTRGSGERPAQAAFLLAALCPFLANYAAAALTETLAIFFAALALDLALHGFGVRSATDEAAPCAVLARDSRLGTRDSWTWLCCGLAVGAGTLLRPDGGILLAAIGAYFCLRMVRVLRRPSGASDSRRPGSKLRSLIVAGCLVALGALAPLVPWTLRNLHTFHRFEPLAPRYANDSGESPMPGFNRWVKTWMAEYVSVEDIYWNVPGGDISLNSLPRRAFDSARQKQLTSNLFADYNRDHDMTPELDARFLSLAADRIHNAPLRYYVWLPALRIADMWLRPRIDLFPSDPRWWQFNDDRLWLTVSLAFGVINLAYVALGIAGLVRSRALSGIGLLLLFVALRSLFLGTIENPEPRYTLECYPVIIVWAAAWFQGSASLPNN
jgi:hypothetical protein